MITKQDTIAIIGASNDKSKYGNIVSKNLISKNFNIIPINPKEKEILGKKVYKSIKDVLEKIDVAVFIVPSKITENIIQDVKLLGIKKVWMQPGSESKKAIKFCEENRIECIHNACITMK